MISIACISKTMSSLLVLGRKIHAICFYKVDILILISLIVSNYIKQTLALINHFPILFVIKFIVIFFETASLFHHRLIFLIEVGSLVFIFLFKLHVKLNYTLKLIFRLIYNIINF